MNKKTFEKLSKGLEKANPDNVRVLTNDELSAVSGGWLLSATEDKTCGTYSVCHTDGTDDSDPPDGKPEQPCPPPPGPMV